MSRNVPSILPQFVEDPVLTSNAIHSIVVVVVYFAKRVKSVLVVLVNAFPMKNSVVIVVSTLQIHHYIVENAIMPAKQDILVLVVLVCCDAPKVHPKNVSIVV